MTDALGFDIMLKSRLVLNPSQMGNSPNVCPDFKTFLGKSLKRI